MARPAWLLLGALSLGGALAVAQEPLQNLAQALVAKRSEVERLASELEAAKRRALDEERSQALLRTELEREVQAVELELRELREGSRARRADAAACVALRAELRPLVAELAAELRAHVQAAAPFRREERLESLAEVEAELAAERLTPEAALARLWSFSEDELRLTHENGLHRQQLEVAGTRQLVDVAKLGMTLLYYRTAQGEVGLLRPTAAGWTAAPAATPEDAARIRALFQALEKHLRQGLFELPNPYSGRRYPAAPAADVAPATSRGAAGAAQER